MLPFGPNGNGRVGLKADGDAVVDDVFTDVVGFNFPAPAAFIFLGLAPRDVL